MKLIGARLTEVEEGVAEFELDFRPELRSRMVTSMLASSPRWLIQPVAAPVRR